MKLKECCQKTRMKAEKLILPNLIIRIVKF